MILQKIIKSLLIANNHINVSHVLQLFSTEIGQYWAHCLLIHLENLPRFAETIHSSKPITLADINAHHTDWYSIDTNARGTSIVEYLVATNLKVLRMKEFHLRHFLLSSMGIEGYLTIYHWLAYDSSKNQVRSQNDNLMERHCLR